MCETLALAETEVIDLRQQLQAAIELNQARYAAVREALEDWLRCHENVPQPLCSGDVGEPACMCWNCQESRKAFAIDAGKTRQSALKHSSSSGLSLLDIVDDRLGSRCLRCGEGAEMPGALCQECRDKYIDDMTIATIAEEIAAEGETEHTLEGMACPNGCGPLDEMGNCDVCQKVRLLKV